MNNQVSEIQVSYSANIIGKEKVSNSKDLFNIVHNQWNIDTIEMYEEVKILLLNRANKVLGIYALSKGGLSSSVVDIRIILSIALKALASSIILIHNHPSGNLKPSKSDIDITKKLKSACELLDIVLLDHLIVTKGDYFSFADDGLI